MSNNDIVGSIPAQTEEIDNRLIADQGNGELREQPFRMHWIEQVEEERDVSSVAASTRNELVARLAEFDATFVVVELVDNGRVVASVLTTAADVVRWQPEETALPRPLLGLPETSQAPFPVLGWSLQ